MGGEASGGRHGGLEGAVTWLVDPTPAYGCHDASTQCRRPLTVRPSTPPGFQFELKHVQHHKARNSSYFLGLYLMIQAES
jgi:hypothetical protein